MKAINETTLTRLPVLPLRGLTAFPNMIIHFDTEKPGDSNFDLTDDTDSRMDRRGNSSSGGIPHAWKFST